MGDSRADSVGLPLVEAEDDMSANDVSDLATAGAAAIGALEALRKLDAIPADYIDRVDDIIARWKSALTILKAKL